MDTIDISHINHVLRIFPYFSQFPAMAFPAMGGAGRSLCRLQRRGTGSDGQHPSAPVHCGQWDTPRGAPVSHGGETWRLGSCAGGEKDGKTSTFWSFLVGNSWPSNFLAWFGANFSCVLCCFFMCVKTFPCSESSLIFEQRFDQFAEAASSAC